MTMKTSFHRTESRKYFCEVVKSDFLRVQKWGTVDTIFTEVIINCILEVEGGGTFEVAKRGIFDVEKVGIPEDKLNKISKKIGIFEVGKSCIFEGEKGGFFEVKKSNLFEYAEL